MKKAYENVEITVIFFDTEDIVCTSLLQTRGFNNISLSDLLGLQEQK